VNEDVDQRTLLRKYEPELRKLRAELQQRQREVVDKRHLLAVRLPSILQRISALQA
jgi:kinesin family protein 3/17